MSQNNQIRIENMPSLAREHELPWGRCKENHGDQYNAG